MKNLKSQYDFIRNELVVPFFQSSGYIPPPRKTFPIYLVGSGAMAYDLGANHKRKSVPTPRDWDLFFENRDNLYDRFIEFIKNLSKDSIYNIVIQSSTQNHYGCQNNMNSKIIVSRKNISVNLDVFCPCITIGEWLEVVPFAYDGIAVNIMNGTVMMTSEYNSDTNFMIKSRVVYTAPSNIDRAIRKGLAK